MSPRVQELYMNDVVYRFDKRRQIVFGVVLDTYEFCAPDDSYLLCKGQIRVYWFNQRGREQVVMQSQVHLLSRSVVDGDIVRRLEKGKETQRGYCRSVSLRSAVRIMGTNKVIENVDHARFMALHPIPNTMPVCVGELFGRIISCDYVVRLKSRDGSLLNYRYNNTFGALVTSRFLNKGSTVDLVPANLKPVKWMKKTRTMERNMQKLHTFHVRWVKPLDVTINVHSVEGNFIYNVPKKDLPKLKILKTLEVTVPRFNETRTMHIEPTDEVMQKWSWIAKQTLKHRADLPTSRKDRAKNRRNSKTLHLVRSPRVAHPPTFSALNRSGEARDWHNEDDDDPEWTTDDEEESPKSPRPHRLPLKRTFVVEALCTDAKATVIWQDGTIEEDVPTTQLYYSFSLDDHEFFPGEWVVRADDMGLYGVVQKASYLERTALVKWFTYDSDANTPTFAHVAEVSVYDIKQHPSFLFRPGGVVHRTNMCPNNIGTVVDSYPEGFVRVLWVTGEEEDCWPQHISILPEVKLVLGEDSDDEDGAHSLQMTWETESVETMCGDISIDTPWHLLAKRLQFIRSRIVFLKKALLNSKCGDENFSILKCLLSVYENSIYLDKLLDTQYFSIRSSHYQALLAMIKEKAKAAGVEIHSRLSDSHTEIEGLDSFDQLLKLEDQLQKNLLKDATGEPSTPLHHRDPCCLSTTRLCIELLSMLKCRLDLSFAEVVSHMGEPQSAWVLSNSCEASPQCTATSTPMPSSSSTPDDSLTSISNTPSKLGDCNMDLLTIPSMNWNNGEESPAPVHQVPQQSFEVLDEAPMYHRFYHTAIKPSDSFRFYRAVTNENKLLSEALPPGVWVYTYADRLDLYSVMIRGPNNTPYEDGLFIFDIQLGADYPRTPPHCNYISYSSERLNPNLYVEGKVCVSLLGTWVGCGTEVWGPKSTLLQLIVSIQGLILVAEPYYNEAGYEKQCKSQQGYENSRTYNELVLLLLVQSMTDMCEHPYRAFRDAICEHFRTHSGSLLRRLGGWLDGTYDKEPEFSLLPVSKGLKLSLRSCLQRFKEVCDKHVSN